MPAGGLGEAGVGDPFSVATDVVDPGGQGEGREQGMSRVVDVKRGSEGSDRFGMPGAGSVEEPEAENNPVATVPGEPAGVLFGGKGRAEIGAMSHIGVFSDTRPAAG